MVRAVQTTQIETKKAAPDVTPEAAMILWQDCVKIDQANDSKFENFRLRTGSLRFLVARRLGS